MRERERADADAMDAKVILHGLPPAPSQYTIRLRNKLDAAEIPIPIFWITRLGGAH